MDAFLTTAMAAKVLGISRKTLEKWRVIGGGPRYRKMGRLVRYCEKDLYDWANRDIRNSTSDPGPAGGENR
jgi:excisionase family DNA binding protein